MPRASFKPPFSPARCQVLPAAKKLKIFHFSVDKGEESLYNSLCIQKQVDDPFSP